MITSGTGDKIHGLEAEQAKHFPRLSCLIYLNEQGIVESADGDLEGLFGHQQLDGKSLADLLNLPPSTTPKSLSSHLQIAQSQPDHFDAHLTSQKFGAIPIKVDLSYQGNQVYLATISSFAQETLSFFASQQSRILEMVASGKSLDFILTELIGLIESVLPDIIGTILLLSPDKKIIGQSFAPSMPPEYGIALVGQSNRPDFGTCGSAMYHQKTIVTTDIANELAWKDYKDLVLPLGLKACWSTPIFSDDRQILGAFGVYYREKRRPQSHETAILDSACHMAAVAVVHHRNLAMIQRALNYQTHLLDNFPALVWKTGRDGHAEYFNKLWLKFTGHTLEKEIERGWLAGIHPDDRERVLSQFIVANGKRSAFEIRYRFLRRDGVYRWLEDHGEPMTDLEGEFSGYMGSCQDITETLQAEAEAKEKNRQLHEMLQNVHLLAVILNCEGKITFCNDFLLELTGWTREEIMGADWFERFIPVDADVKPAFLKVISEKEIPHHYENEIVAKDGRRFLIAWNNTLLLDTKGNPLGTTSIGEDITAKRNALEAVRENQRVLSTLLSNLAGMAYRCRIDEHWTMDFVSDGCFGLTGYKPEELLGNKRISYEEITHPDDRQRVREEIYLALAPGKQFDLEYRIITEQGQERWVWERGIGIKSLEGKMLFLEGFITDITQKKQYEEQLHRIQMAVENASDCIRITEPNGRALFHNRAFREQLGYLPEDLSNLGESASIYVAPEKHRKIVQALLLGNTWTGDIQIYNAMREVRDFHLRANPILDANGKIVALMGVFTDVSERIRAQQKIAEQGALLDRAQDAIIIRDLHSTITYWNQGAANLYGWQNEEALGKPVIGLLYRESASYLNTIQLLLRDGEWSGEMHHLTKSGREVIVESRWTLLRDDRGNPQSILTINTDITEKKRLEAQFLRAQRMESIGTLAGGIAHDLNNVLAPIIMSIDLLRMSSKSASDLEILDQIDTSARRGADLVKQVLSFARGVGGRRVIINVTNLIKDVVKISKETFPRSIEIKSKKQDGLHSVIGDPTQLHQVLINLCVNARDALPQGGSLTVSACNMQISDEMAERMQAQPGHFVQITVADTGTGIPPEIHDKIFEPFFTTKEIGKGTGLGLSTVLAIVRSHGGFLRVESEVGQGSQFHIYLPYSDQMEEALSSHSKTVVPRGNGETILVVEDEPPVRTLLKSILESHGYQVVIAENGAKGISTYAQSSQDIKAVITDMMMPVMDGPAMIQSLRKISPKLPIIAISGLYETLNIEKATAAGANRFVAKPFAVETILQTLHSVIHQAG